MYAEFRRFSAEKAGSDVVPVRNFIQILRTGPVGDNHVAARIHAHLGGPQLGDHAAGAQRAARVPGQGQNFRRDGPHLPDQLRRRVPPGVAGIEALNVAHQHQQVRVGVHRHDGPQGVVVPHRDLRGGHGIILVDDRQRPQLQQPEQRVLEVHPPLGVLHVRARQQHLGHGVVVL